MSFIRYGTTCISYHAYFESVQNGQTWSSRTHWVECYLINSLLNVMQLATLIATSTVPAIVAHLGSNLPKLHYFHEWAWRSWNIGMYTFSNITKVKYGSRILCLLCLARMLSRQEVSAELALFWMNVVDVISKSNLT